MTTMRNRDQARGMYVYMFCDMREQGQRNYKKVQLRIAKQQLLMLFQKAMNSR